MSIDVDLIKIIAGVLAVLTIIFLIIYCKNPFKFPYKEIMFDVSSKRQPDIMDYIDQYLIEHKMTDIDATIEDLNRWITLSDKKIKKSMFKKHRYNQYMAIYDEKHLFKFVFYRIKTRYRQVNYVKYSYKVQDIDKIYSTDYSFIKERYNQLSNIDFQCTLREYHSNNQRKLMTKELRDRVAMRDHYRCQKCGKYMPDGVGLHIDHIVPISKGGKSVLSNLQVLCSKCNGAKSNKI